MDLEPNPQLALLIGCQAPWLLWESHTPFLGCPMALEQDSHPDYCPSCPHLLTQSLPSYSFRTSPANLALYSWVYGIHNTLRNGLIVFPSSDLSVQMKFYKCRGTFIIYSRDAARYLKDSRCRHMTQNNPCVNLYIYVQNWASEQIEMAGSHQHCA